MADILAEWSTKNATLKTAYAKAAADQLTTLLRDAPRAPSGAISQRGDQVQLWADFVSMAPPFIAYSGEQTPEQN